MTYGKVYLRRFEDASNLNYIGTWKTAPEIIHSKISIKETDGRVKTATFSTVHYFDLTTGQIAVLINSQYYENFSGVIIDVDYDEDKELYTYQCQDWSRLYISKFESKASNVKLYDLLIFLITRGALKPPFSKKSLKPFDKFLSGLLPIGRYDQSLFKGNIYKGNPFNQTVQLIARNKSWIEVIRSLVANATGYYDVWFNDKGILQIEPISKTDWETTGLMLSDGEYYDRKFKFSTANAITSVIVNGSDLNNGIAVKSSENLGLNLIPFFGSVATSISDPNDKNSSNAVKSSSKKTTTSVKSNKYNNPFNNKKKKVWINSDNGSNSMKKALIKELKKNGWSVHDGGTWSNAHIQDVFKLDKSYSVYITLYNGFCAGTMREAYSGYVKNPLKKVGVQLVPIWDSSGWTNPKGMKPYRYGDFTNYNAGRAWDDNFSSGNPSIKNVGSWLKKNKATYCVGPSASQIMKQFNAGGYFKYKGIKV